MNPNTKPLSTSFAVSAFCRLTLIVLLLASAPFSRAVLIDGLVSYWPLDSNDGGVATDLSFGNNLIIAGTPTVDAGQFGNAFTFGPGIYLTNTVTYDNNDTGLPIYGARSYTVCMWVKGAAQTARYLYSEGNTTNNNPIFLIQTGQVAANNGKLDVILRNTKNVTLINHVVTDTTVFDNNWHHIAFVDDRGTVSIYIDGVLDTGSSRFNYIRRVDQPDLYMNTVAIGTLLRGSVSATTVNFDGQIDEVATWERALSEAEINEIRTTGIYTQGVPIPARPPTLLKSPTDVTKRLGEWHVLEVDVGGNRPITYQWSVNGTPIPEATGPTYQVKNLHAINTGDFYSCAVTNANGFAITTNATFTVLDDPAPNPTNGLVNYWPLDVFDANTNSPELHFGHDMVMVNFDTNSQILPSLFGNAPFFISAAPATYGYRTNGAPIYNRTNYTISMWVNGDGASQGDRRVFSEGSTASDTPLFTLGTDNATATASLYPFVRGSTSGNSPIVARLSTRPVFDNSWHHIVWTDANGEAKLYVDGVLDETDYRYVRPILSDLNQTSIGAVLRTGVGNFFLGYIDEVATWNRVLSWTEIQQVMTNGVPVPDQVVLPPVITVQPQDLTKNVFIGDTVSFSVVVNGTPPFTYQWFKNGSPISGAENPSALTSTLSLTNVQAVDSNTTYSVSVSNPADTANSSAAVLYVFPVEIVTSGEVLKVDVGLAGSSNPQPGFDEFTLAKNPASFNKGARLTFAGVLDAPLAARNRVTGAMVANSASMTQAQIYNDFIFANLNADGAGLSVLIENLAPNTPHGVTIWSYDPQSNNDRIADWTEISSGAPIVVTNGYTFNGAVVPTADFERTFGGLFTSSPSGTLEFQGIRNGGNGVAVFVNAIRVVANPVATGITKAAVVGGNLQITVETEYFGMEPNIEQTTDLVNGPWVPAVGGTVVSSTGPVVVVEFPISSTGNIFYRGKRIP